MKTDSNSVPNKRWLQIIPATMLVYIVAYMDRTNIAIAMAGGMNQELGMTATIAGLAAGIFFVGYMFLQVPGGHVAEKYSAKRFIAYTIVFWGFFAILTGFVHNSWQLLAIRFILGVAEGGVYPAILALISHWFPNRERARAIAYFQMNLAVAAIITSPLSGWLIALHGWREMFIIEGVLSLALLFVWVPMVADHPHQAKWLSVREKTWIEVQLAADQLNNPYITDKKSKFNDIVGDINIWKLIGIYFFMQVGFYGFSLWMPSLIKEITHSGMGKVGILSIFPYILTIAGQYWFAKRCDATMNRRLYTALPFIGFALCLFLSILLQQNMWMSYGMMVICGFFLQAYAGPFWTLPALLFPPNVVGGVRGSVNALGNLGGFIGPYMVGALTTNVGQATALYTLVGSLLIAAALTFTLPAITANARTASQVIENVMAER